MISPPPHCSLCAGLFLLNAPVSVTPEWGGSDFPLFLSGHPSQQYDLLYVGSSGCVFQHEFCELVRKDWFRSSRTPFLRPGRQNGKAIHRVIPNESEQRIPSRSARLRAQTTITEKVILRYMIVSDIHLNLKTWQRVLKHTGRDSFFYIFLFLLRRCIIWYLKEYLEWIIFTNIFQNNFNSCKLNFGWCGKVNFAIQSYCISFKSDQSCSLPFNSFGLLNFFFSFHLLLSKIQWKQ